MSEVMIVRRGSNGFSTSNAVLHVNAPAGSTLYFSKGGVVVKTLGPEKGHVNADKDTLADWYFSINPVNYGVWTVTAERGAETTSGTITVNNNRKYDLTVDYGLWLIKDGKKVETFTTANASMTEESDGYVNWGRSGLANCVAYTSVDVTGYKRLVIDVRAAAVYDSHGTGIGISYNTPANDATAGKTFNDVGSPTTFTLDVSSYTGTAKPFIRLASDSSYNYMQITNFYLTRETS